MNALEKLRKAIEGMTAGPWSVAENFPAWEIHHPSQYGIPAVGIRIGGNYGNALGIALLRNCAEEMLAVCEAAQAEIDRVERYKVATSDNEKMAISKESADHYFDVREALAALDRKVNGVGDG